MASNPTCGDPSSIAMSTSTVAAALTSNSTKASVATAAKSTSSARPTTNAQQLHSISQPRTPQFLQHHPQRHHPFQHHQHASVANQQQHQPGVFAAPTTIQTQPHLHIRLAKASESIRYPLASSGRGLLPAPRGIMPELVANSGAYPPMASSIVPNSCAPQQYQHLHHHSQLSAPSDSSYSSHLVRGPFLHPSHAHMSSISISAAARGIHPQTKAGSSPYCAPDSDAPKDPIDKCTDDTLVTLRDRKVRISDGASLYALCRLWLRNGYVEDNEPQYDDVLKSLPKPLPLPLPLREYSSPKRKERDDETEVDEGENLVNISNAEELLTRHVKRAKRVRARLREERSQRIERYKSRLALLLPPNGNMQE